MVNHATEDLDVSKRGHSRLLVHSGIFDNTVRGLVVGDGVQFR